MVLRNDLGSKHFFVGTHSGLTYIFFRNFVIQLRVQYSQEQVHMKDGGLSSRISPSSGE